MKGGNPPQPEEHRSCLGFPPLRCQSRSPCPSCGSSSPSLSLQMRIHSQCSLLLEEQNSWYQICMSATFYYVQTKEEAGPSTVLKRAKCHLVGFWGWTCRVCVWCLACRGIHRPYRNCRWFVSWDWHAARKTNEILLDLKKNNKIEPNKPITCFTIQMIHFGRKTKGPSLK